LTRSRTEAAAHDDEHYPTGLDVCPNKMGAGYVGAAPDLPVIAASITSCRSSCSSSARTSRAAWGRGPVVRLLARVAVTAQAHRGLSVRPADYRARRYRGAHDDNP
jgi:hypothetical protein